MHSLLQDLMKAHQGPKSKQITSGLKLPFRAAKFLKNNRELVPLVIVPAVINFILFSVSAFLLLTNASDLLDWLWARPIVDGVLDYLWLALWYVAYALALVLAVATSYVVVLVVGGIVASPFHDILSERTEKLLRGVDALPESDTAMVSDIIRSIFSSAFVGLTYIAVMIPILLLNLIPVAGSAAASVLGACVSAFFVSLEYSDPALERHDVRIKDKFGLIRENFALAGSFGLGTSMLLWVPFLNFLCMPIAVIGGTALALVLEDESLRRGAGTVNAEPERGTPNAER